MNRSDLYQVFILALGVFTLACPPQNPPTEEGFVWADTDLAPLEISGNQILNSETQEPFAMRGIVFTSGVWTSYGHQNANDIRYMNSEADFDRVKSWGVNAVRFYLNYFWFQGVDAEDGWAYMDEVLNWARERDMYLIPVLAIYPNFNPRAGHSFLINEEAKDQVEVFWESFAQRYKGNHPEIAAFDILYEPESEHMPQTIYDYATRLVDAIRAVDPERLIVYEAIGWANPFTLQKLDREGIIYEPHFFEPFGFTAAEMPWMSEGGIEPCPYPGDMVTDLVFEQNDKKYLNYDSQGDWAGVNLYFYVPDGLEADTAYFCINGPVSGEGVTIDSLRQRPSIPGVEVLFPNGDFETPRFAWEVHPMYYGLHNGAQATTSDSYDGQTSVFLPPGSTITAGGQWLDTRLEIPFGSADSFNIRFFYKGKMDNLEVGVNYKREVTEYYDKSRVSQAMADSMDAFAIAHDVPIFVGELSPSLTLDKSSYLSYLQDVLDLIDQRGYSWTFYPYRETWTGPYYMGLYNGVQGATTEECQEESQVIDFLKTVWAAE
jgi:hypothetical protein